METTNLREKILNAIKKGQPLVVKDGKLIPKNDLSTKKNQNTTSTVQNDNLNNDEGEFQVEIKPHDWGV